MPTNPPDTPPGMADEGLVARKPGRPRKRPPISSILSIVKGLLPTALEGGQIDPGVARKYLADLAAITMEECLLSDEPLTRRGDWALRMSPLLATLEAMAPKDKGAVYPKTERALDTEIMARFNKINKLIDGPKEPEVDAILDTLAPAAQEPPAEA